MKKTRTAFRPSSVMPPNQAVIYGIDVGCFYLGVNAQPLAATTFAWSRLDGWPQVVPQHCIDHRDITALAARLGEDLQQKRRVAIGIEAPMWLPLVPELEPGGHAFAARFEQEYCHEWYLQSGAAASVKAVALCHLVFQLAGEQINLTTDLHRWLPKRPLCFEGFICGDYRDEAHEGENQHFLDAFAVAFAGWQCYCGPPEAVVHHHHAGTRNGPSASLLSLIAMASAFVGEVLGPTDCDTLSLEPGYVSRLIRA